MLFRSGESCKRVEGPRLKTGLPDGESKPQRGQGLAHIPKVGICRNDRKLDLGVKCGVEFVAKGAICVKPAPKGDEGIVPEAQLLLDEDPELPLL